MHTIEAKERGRMGTSDDVNVVEAGNWIGRDVAQGCVA